MNPFNVNYLSLDNRKPDGQYKAGLQAILERGTTLPASRQGAPSRLLPWGHDMVFPIENGFPFDGLRTLRGAFHKFIGEATWILTGDVSLELLHRYGVDYWDSWCTAEMCDRHGIAHDTFGATYGHHFRNFGGEFSPETGGFLPNGVDQLRYIVDGLKENPHWRRWLITPFNPQEYDRVEIVPCHGELFFLAANGDLYLHLVQRSGDWPVGVPSNMVMWAFGGMLIAGLTGLRFRGMRHFVSNAHFYGDPEASDDNRHSGDQTPGVRILLEREPVVFPTVQLDDRMLRVAQLIYEGIPNPLDDKLVNPASLDWPTLLKELVTLNDYNPHSFIDRRLLPISV